MPALIFDCDGVLADTERDGHRPAFSETFAEVGLPVRWSEQEHGVKLQIAGGKERMASLLTDELVRANGLPPDAEEQKELLDAACPGDVFAAPPSDYVYETTKLMRSDKGLLHIINNYTGDRMSFDMGRELAEAEDIKIATMPRWRSASSRTQAGARGRSPRAPADARASALASAAIDQEGVVQSSEATVIAAQFIEAFPAVDFARMRALLAEDLVAYVTNAGGGMDEVHGADGFVARLEAMDLRAAQFSVEPTQQPVVVEADLVLLMVEIRARRSGRSLHNFAAHLLRIADRRIIEWRMVDAKPAESDAFWA